MISGMLLAILALEQGLGVSAPPLSVIGVTTRSSQTDATCLVEIRNDHAVPAIAWVIERLPDRSGGHTTDRVKYPEIALEPHETYKSTFACELGEPLTVQIGAVLYADASVSGDIALLDQRILALRRKEARGFRELALLLRSVRVPSGTTSLSERMAELVDSSSGPEISASVKFDAKLALRRIWATQSTVNDESVIRGALIREIDEIVRRLESFSIQR